MFILVQFIFRLSFGMAAAMAVTPPRLVTSGYYRNHLYVLLGLNVLASLVAVSRPEQFAVWPPLCAAALCYIGSVAWLYEKPRVGIVLLALVAIVALLGAWTAVEEPSDATMGHSIEFSTVSILRWLDPMAGGLVLGVTLAAMFLGHWYLNAPSMELAPLRRLVALMAVALMLRAIICGVALGLEIADVGVAPSPWPMLIALRWLAGLIGALIVTGMTWQTLKIPNTQSATGILYVAVIGTFLGELTALLLSAESNYPL